MTEKDLLIEALQDLQAQGITVRWNEKEFETFEPLKERSISLTGLEAFDERGNFIQYKLVHFSAPYPGPEKREDMKALAAVITKSIERAGLRVFNQDYESIWVGPKGRAFIPQPPVEDPESI